ncbi:MAG: winged helix-turn-helix domain-containing protein [Candidatus Bathyarchaeota archaeon]|nr:winged helix-turn-helix domain-containing protein [Candidatus Bathyarchaeum tardum]
MRRSKLELHLDILKCLVEKRHIKITHIIYKVNINCTALKEYLEFLVNQGLVEEKTLKNHRKVYKITEKGNLALQHFQKLHNMLPVTDGEVTFPLAIKQNKITS